MAREEHRFNVAGHCFSVAADSGFDIWSRLMPHYEGFRTAGSEPSFSMTLERNDGPVIVPQEAMAEIYREESPEPGFPGFCVHRDSEGALMFTISYTHKTLPSGWMFADKGLSDFRLILGTEEKGFLAESTLTLEVMLAYNLATTRRDTLTMHASCILCGGRAFLFLGKSGTGKSTHARLWLSNIAGAELMNDDHPVIRISADGTPIAYGSPWSGKTDCYKNLSAPVAAIVKIEQAPHNRIRRLSPIEAYSKLMSAAAGVSWFKELGDGRHKSLEAVVAGSYFYELQCLPDDEAALLCHKAVTGDEKDC